MKKQKFTLSESVTSGAIVREKPRIDEVKGIVYNVKVLGKKSRNGKEYTPSAINDAIRLCEGATSYQNHPTKEELDNGGRFTEKRFGRIRGMFKENGEAYCKQYHFNPKHPYASQFIWQIQNDPNGIGLSYFGDGEGYIKGNGVKVIENLTQCISVDLVDNPGTTMSLFEQHRSINVGKKKLEVKEQDAPLDAAATGVMDDTSTDHNTHLVEAIKSLADSVKDGSVDVEDVKTRINAILDLISGDNEGDSEPSEVVEQLRQFDNKLMNAAAEIISDKIIIREQLDICIQTAKNAGLKDEHISEQFKKQLINADTDEEIKEVIDDRRKLLGLNKRPIALAPKKAKVQVSEQKRDNIPSDGDINNEDRADDLSQEKLKDLANKLFTNEEF
jgi:hypothetical protein